MVRAGREPDGYQYTFDTERLWRKNLRDNNGDGQITVGDGVDPNRNFVDHWGYDNEGSSNEPFSETYRGPSPASEPETQAMQGLINRIHPGSCQTCTPSVSGSCIRRAGRPAPRTPTTRCTSRWPGPTLIPRLPTSTWPSADTLYVTNGETTDYADGQGAVAFTPELGQGEPGAGFVFLDDEALIQPSSSGSCRST